MLAHITQEHHEKDIDFPKSVMYHNNRTVFPICKQKLHIIKNTMPQRKKKGKKRKKREKKKSETLTQGLSKKGITTT